MKHPTWYYIALAISALTIAFCVAFWTSSQPSEGWRYVNGAFVNEQTREMCQLSPPDVVDSTSVILCIDFKTGMKGVRPIISPRF